MENPERRHAPKVVRPPRETTGSPPSENPSDMDSVIAGLTVVPHHRVNAELPLPASTYRLNPTQHFGRDGCLLRVEALNGGAR